MTSLIPPVRILIRTYLCFSLVPCLTERQVCMPDPWWGQTIPTCWSLEQRKVSCKERNGTGLKTPKLLESSQLNPLLRKGRKAQGECKHLGGRVFVLEVRAGRGTCSCKPLSNQRYSLFWQNRPRWGGTTLPSEVVVLAERRQSSASGSLRARAADPVQQSSLREPGAQDPASSQAPQAAPTAGAGPADSGPGRRPLPLGRRCGDGGKGHRHLKAWARPLRAVCPCRTQPPTCPLGPQITRWTEAGWVGGPWGEGWDSPLTSLPAWTIAPPTQRLCGMGPRTVTYWGCSLGGCVHGSINQAKQGH